MPSRTNVGVIVLVVLLMGLTGVTVGARAEVVCAAGPAAVQAMLELSPTTMGDENSPIWQQASRCDWVSISDATANLSIGQFRQVALDNGLAGALRTFARNGNFRLYLPDENAMDLNAADQYLKRHPWNGTWRESSRGASPDATLLFAVGEVTLAKKRVYQYIQVWQFDSKVANWGVRLLVLGPLPKK